MQVATEFEHYIRHNPIKEHDPCAGNGVVKHIQRFKRLVNWAVEIEWIKVNPFEKYNCPLKKNVRKKLSIQELVALEENQISNETLRYVRDFFQLNDLLISLSGSKRSTRGQKLAEIGSSGIITIYYDAATRPPVKKHSP